VLYLYLAKEDKFRDLPDGVINFGESSGINLKRFVCTMEKIHCSARLFY
jgi:hypothetical protein